MLCIDALQFFILQPFSVDVGYERFLGPEIFFHPEVREFSAGLYIPYLLKYCKHRSPRLRHEKFKTRRDAYSSKYSCCKVLYKQRPVDFWIFKLSRLVSNVLHVNWMLFILVL